MKTFDALLFASKSSDMITLAASAQPVQSQVPIPNLDLLDSYPTLKFLAALITFAIVVIGGLAWLKGEKMGKAEGSQSLTSPRAQDAAVQLFFDGPLKAIFDDLQALKAGQQMNKLEYRDETARLVSAAKHEVLNRLLLIQGEIIRELNEAHGQNLSTIKHLADEFNELKETIIRLDEFMRRGRK